MVKQEWKNIFHNTWIKVVMVAIIAIPSIYACVFLGSMWDPYGNTGFIPVAVVNEDQEVTYNDKSLAVGEELVKNLKDNDSMDFHFVNARDAQEGLEKGDYYMTITIPSNFSKNATTLLDDHPQKMILNYTTNPGTNYIASKMDDSAIAKIKTEVSASVTKTYAETIFNQIGTLSDGLGEASDGTHKLSDGVNQLVNGNKTISDNLKVLADSSLTFKDGASTLTNGLKDYTDGVVTVNKGVYTLKNGLNTLNNSTGQLSQGVHELNKGAVLIQTGVNQYTAGVSEVNKGTAQLVSNNNQLKTGVSELSKGVQALTAGNQAVVDGVNTLANSVKSSQASLKGYQTIIKSLQGLGKQDLANKILLGTSLTQDEKNILSQNFHVDYDLPSAAEVIQTASTGLDDISVALEGGTTSKNQKVDKGLVTGSQEVQAGLNQVNAKVNSGSYYTVDKNGQPVKVTVDKNSSLVAGITAYTQGVSDVHNGLKELTANNSTLNSGVKDLADGTSQLTEKTPTLIDGVKELDNGANTLYQGTSQLVSHNQTLLGGSSQLDDGASQISSGAGQLADGSSTLGSGLKEVKSGVKTLDGSLTDGAKKSKMTTRDSTYEMMAQPVDTTHQEISKVENNGHAMAPYMMSVALYVAGLAFTLMYPIRRGIKEAESGWKYWVSKASVMYAVSTLAAVVMISCLRLINGFEPQQLLMTYLFAILVSAAFMSIIVLLNMTTGYIGEFLLLVFMIINLGGSAGTYPLQTSTGFFKAIHNFVPYTYSVDGFRKVISMASASLTTEIWVFVGIFAVCTLLTICYFQFKNKEDKHIIPETFEKVNED